MFRLWENCTTVTLRDVPVDVDDNDGHEVCDKKHRQHLSMDAKQIVLNVYNGLMEIDELSTSKAIVRTSQLTKIPESTIRKIVTVGVCGRKKRCDSGKFREVTSREVDILRQKIYSFYGKNEVVTVATLRDALMNDAIEYSKSTLRRVLIANGFKYQKIDRRQCMMESSRIRIPSDTLEDELIPFFATIGVVVKFKLLTLQNSLYNSGFAVVTYCDSPVADIAVKVLNYAYFNGIILTVEKVSDNCRLFLGGIPETKSKDEVWRALSRYGITGIVDVIMYRSYRNRAFNRGYVFIEFHTYVEAAQVRVLYKNLVLWGEKMAIDWSEPIPSVTDDIMCKGELEERKEQLLLTDNNIAVPTSIRIEKAMKCIIIISLPENQT
ncbi:heterogeneous nuclear ribonucleoprotein [Holotrichia oblita]|uniref:Heterogeneous nuclear ribonucleoprotein n=1 Tax=Holotrichia oblita TaxID=644536 RepID=A0ACB9TW52_HOLOL|nr:heterogeneous nuclear ribonucleoprotein [Holotrichia oblita]